LTIFILRFCSWGCSPSEGKGGAFLRRDQSGPVYTHTRANYVFVIK